jgi:hypothetical protein
MTEIEWLRMAKKNLEGDLAETRREAKSSEASARFWRESFERIAYDVGDLLQLVRAGGRVTEEHLAGVLDREAQAGGP